MIQAKRDRIAPISIFFLLFISRIVVSLTNVQSVTTGLMKTDILISIIASMVIVLVLSIPAIFCIKNHKNPLDVKWVGGFYSLYYIFLAGVNISRFSYFASTTLNPDSQAWVFSIIVAVCAFYGAYLGIEGLARFSAFAFVLLISAIIVALVFNVQNFELINLFPIVTNSRESIIKNTVFMVSNSAEVAMLLCLSKKVNGVAIKQFLLSVLFSFLTMLLLFLFVIGVMGNSASLQAFPLYSLFQTAKVGLFERIDILFISFWIFGVFIKAVMLIYCSVISFKPIKNSKKCIISSALSLLTAIVLTEFVQVGRISPYTYAVLFLAFCFIIPLLTLILKKRNLGDELVEKF